MALFSRIDPALAENLLESWPQHYWVQKSIKFILDQAKNKEHIKNVPLNKGLLESVKKNGFESPFLVLHTWYPVCGSQRLRVAQEMPIKWQKKTKVWVCRFNSSVYTPLFYWPNKEEGHKAVQQYFQMLEVVFKTLYMPSHSSSGKRMIDYEEEGNQLHWPARDGQRMKPGIIAGNNPALIQSPTMSPAPQIRRNPMASAVNQAIQFGK